MKFQECPNCGANLDFGEKCDCKKKKDTSAGTEVSQKSTVTPHDDDSIPQDSENVNACFRLKEIRELTGIQAKDIAKTVQEVFPKFSRQIMSQCESYEKYGCIPHPDVVKFICKTYGVKLDDIPVSVPRKSKKDVRRLNKRITIRMTENDYAWLEEQLAKDDFPTIQSWFYSKIKKWRESA